MHYYQFNIGDYSSHTKGLSPIEDLAYRRLIDEYYLAEQPFNGCSTDVARLIGLREYQQEVDYVLNRYFVNQDERWTHGRIEKEIDEYKEKQEKRSNAGKKSAEARQRQACVEHVLIECSTDVQLTNNHKPITNNHKKSSGKPLVTFTSWLSKLKESGEKPIPEDDPIFDYAESAKIPSYYLRVCWIEFKARYTLEDKKYKDWRAVFNKAVRANWFEIWYHNGTDYQLTTKGHQAMLSMNNQKGS